MARQAQTAQRGDAARPAGAALPSSGALSTSYEVQIFREKRWRIDSMFDDKSLALYEARRMNDSGRYVCVRVVEEYFDEVTGQTRLSTVYRGGRIEQAHQKDLDDAIKMRRDIRHQEGVAEKEAAASAATASGVAKRKKSTESRLMLMLGIAGVVVLLLAGVVAVLLLK